MAGSDPISEGQLSFIDSMAREALVDYDTAVLDALLKPVYDCGLFELNRGQASMVIDDFKQYLQRPDATEIDWQSIFEGM